MDSACILACAIEKVCSQYDANLFADHVHWPLLPSVLVCVGLPPSLQLTPTISASPPPWPLLSQRPGPLRDGETLDQLRLRLRLRPRLRLEGGGSAQV